jgi:hypothetical protein
MTNSAAGVMRCTREGCGGSLGSSGQEVTRLVCVKCGQNYQVRVALYPIEVDKPELILPAPEDRAK